MGAAWSCGVGPVIVPKTSILKRASAARGVKEQRRGRALPVGASPGPPSAHGPAPLSGAPLAGAAGLCTLLWLAAYSGAGGAADA